MPGSHARPTPPTTDDITVDFGIDDIILSYHSDYWIAADHDDGVQQWDIGMHFAEDGPGPQFGRISLHLVDHNRCFDPIAACDALSEDLFTISKALFDPSLGLRQDLWDRLSCPGNTIIVDSVSIDSRLRGHGLGVLLTGMALDYLSNGTGVIALFPGPVERRTDTPYEEACARLGRAWSRLGFTPYRDGVWILDPGLITLHEAVAAEQQRLAGHRWRITLRYTSNHWGGDITAITSVMSKSAPWSRPPTAYTAPLQAT
ncbi:hypothetical protein AB0D74_43205 [Streptomyces sp. NPDC048278]|uniref:hypothetical protein n=1 Tax=Streptomyces sp. NPDC048278 TaxID=3155809 RepID=UPI00344A1465